MAVGESTEAVLVAAAAGVAREVHEGEQTVDETTAVASVEVVPAEVQDVAMEVEDVTVEAVMAVGAVGGAADPAGVSAAGTRHAPPPPPPALRQRSSLVRALSAVGLWPIALKHPSTPESAPLRPTSEATSVDTDPLGPSNGLRQETTSTRKWEVKDPALGVRLTRR